MHAPVWDAEINVSDRRLFEVQCYKTQPLMRQCLLGNKLFAWCHVVVFVSLWKVNVGTMNYGSPWGAVAGQVKEKIDLIFFLYQPKSQTRINRFYRFITQSSLETWWLIWLFCVHFMFMWYQTANNWWGGTNYWLRKKKIYKKLLRSYSLFVLIINYTNYIFSHSLWIGKINQPLIL